jgi:hypothetical protein
MLDVRCWIAVKTSNIRHLTSNLCFLCVLFLTSLRFFLIRSLSWPRHSRWAF